MLDIELKIWRGSREFAEALKALYAPRWHGTKRNAYFLPLAEAHLRLDETDEAEALLTAGLKVMPGYRAAMVTLARLYYAQGRVDESRPLLEDVVRRWPDALTAVEALCVLYQAEGQGEKGAVIARRLRDYYPDSGKVMTLLEQYAPPPEAPTEAPPSANSPLADSLTIAEAPQQLRLDHTFDEVDGDPFPDCSLLKPDDRHDEDVQIKEGKEPTFAPQEAYAHEEPELTAVRDENNGLAIEQVDSAPDGAKIIDIDQIDIGAHPLPTAPSSLSPDPLDKLQRLLQKISSVQKDKNGR